MANLGMVRVNLDLIEQFKRRHPELESLSRADIVAIMLRKALECDKS